MQHFPELFLSCNATCRGGRPPQKPIDQACQLHSLFYKHWPRAQRYPDEVACYRLKTQIDIIRIGVVRHRSRVGRPQIPEIIRLARSFLKHLSKVRQQQEENLEIYIDGDYKSDYHCAKLNLTKQTEQQVRAFLDENPARPWRRKPARDIAAAVLKAWRTVDKAKVPRSKESSSPLCGFVVDLLAKIGKHSSAETVRDLLKKHHV